jgi:hypothetical protein
VAEEDEDGGAEMVQPQDHVGRVVPFRLHQ